MKLSLPEMSAATGGEGRRPAPAGSICTDTRAIQAGDWFLALRGERFDGHDYLAGAVEAGAAGVIVERGLADRAPDAAGVLAVDDTLVALQDCARWARGRLGCPVIGLTGSAGKTTTRAMIAGAIGSLGPIHQTRGNLNNHIGVPLTLLAIEGSPAALVLEMGMSAPGEIALLQEIGAPDHRLITNVSAAHLQGTGSIDGVARCKQELFDGGRPGDVVYVNQDDPRVRAMPLPPGVEVVRYGSSIGCDVRLIEAEVDGAALRTRARISTPAGELSVVFGSPGRHLALNAAAAAAVGWRLGVDPAAIAAGISSYEPVGMRMRVERRAGGVTVLNDAYNANPASALASLEALASAAGGRRIALLGDMLELGAGEDVGHEEVVRAAAGMGFERLGLAGPRMGRWADLARSLGAEVVAAADSQTLAEALEGSFEPGDVVLIKGSRGARMERILQSIPALPAEGH